MMSVARGFSDFNFKDYKFDKLIAECKLDEEASLLRKLCENQEPLSSEDCKVIIDKLETKMQSLPGANHRWDLHYLISLAYLDMSDLVSAKKNLEKFLEEVPTGLPLFPMMKFRLALIAQAEGKTSDTIQQLNSIPLTWKFPAAQKVLSDLYRESKDTINQEHAMGRLLTMLPFTENNALEKLQVHIEYVELCFARSKGWEEQYKLGSMLYELSMFEKIFDIDIFIRFLKLLQMDKSMFCPFATTNNGKRKQFYTMLQRCLDFPEVQKALWHGFFYPDSLMAILFTTNVYQSDTFFKKPPAGFSELRSAFLALMEKCKDQNLPERVTPSDMQALEKRDKGLFKVAEKSWIKLCLQKFEKAVLGEEKSISTDKEKKEDVDLGQQASLFKEIRFPQDISQPVNDKFISSLLSVEKVCPEIHPRLYDAQKLLSILQGGKISHEIRERALWKVFATNTPFGNLFAKVPAKQLREISCFLLGLVADRKPKMDEATSEAFKRDLNLLDKMDNNLQIKMKTFLSIGPTAPAPR